MGGTTGLPDPWRLTPASNRSQPALPNCEEAGLKCLTGASIVFIGDSLVRYQYLSFIYWLEYGKWIHSLERPNVCREADWHGLDAWDNYMVASTALFHGNEKCDCSRFDESKRIIENRYYYHSARNIQVSYFNKIGNWGITGRALKKMPGNFTRSKPEYMALKEVPPTWEHTP